MSTIIEVHSANVGTEPNTVVLDVTVDVGTGEIRIPNYVHHVENWQVVEADIRAWVTDNPSLIDQTPVSSDPDPLNLPLPRREFRLAMLHFGLTDSIVEGVIAQEPDSSERQRLTIFWQDTEMFDRNNDLLVGLSAAAGLTSTQVDEMWTYGIGILHGTNPA